MTEEIGMTHATQALRERAEELGSFNPEQNGRIKAHKKSIFLLALYSLY
jgi:hypothetical protein